MNIQTLKTNHYSMWLDLVAIYEIREVSQVVEFDKLLNGFLEGSRWSSFTFDDTYTYGRMRKDWTFFIEGVWWALNN